ncbi:MAG: M14 family metallopeptidase [Deltaproteobacteria bacterium]|nr:M14 family metallopeptidase [Deltaproteobacteria bacterium]
MKMKWVAVLTGVVLMASASAWAAPSTYLVRVDTKNNIDRTAVSRVGLAIEGVDLTDGSVTVRATDKQIQEIGELGFDVTPEPDFALDFPAGMENYHDHAELVAALADVVAAYPSILAGFSAGTTTEGRQIPGVKISDNPGADETEEGAILIAALYHSREPVSLEVALDFIMYLASNYGVDAYVTYLVDNREIYVIPMVNPDGYVYDVENDLDYWRKNRRDNPNTNCEGVDLNRNYSVDFGGGGASSNPCSETYHGPSALSEPETQAMAAFFDAHENVTTALNIHSYGRLILYPWGNTATPIADATDLATHQAIGAAFADLTGYDDMQSYGLYQTSGDAVDWQYGVLGLTAFTLELTDGFGFYPPTGFFR